MPSYLNECLRLKEDKETLSKMYDSMRREYAAPSFETTRWCH